MYVCNVYYIHTYIHIYLCVCVCVCVCVCSLLYNTTKLKTYLYRSLILLYCIGNLINAGYKLSSMQWQVH